MDLQEKSKLLYYMGCCVNSTWGEWKWVPSLNVNGISNLEINDHRIEELLKYMPASSLGIQSNLMKQLLRFSSSTYHFMTLWELWYYLLCPFLILSLNFHNDFKFLTRGSLKLFIGLYHHWNYKAVQSTKMRQKKKLYKEHTWYRIVEHLNKVTGLNRKVSAQIRD